MIESQNPSVKSVEGPSLSSLTERAEAVEGKIITYVDGDKKYPCAVAGCDPYVGITLCGVGKNGEADRKDILMCLRGPSSVQSKGILKDNPAAYDNYPKEFEMELSYLESGVYYINNLKKALGVEPGYSYNMSCAFSQ